jgi:hypothetical protein
MRSKRLLSLALALVAGSLSAGTFVGTIEYQLTSAKGGTHAMSMALSGRKVRSEVTAGKHTMVSIIDLKARTVTTLMPERKAYMVADYGALAPKASPITAVKTGATETIAGYKAQEWAVTRDGKVSSVWLTQALGRGFFQQGGGASVDVPEEWKGKDLLLLRFSRPGGARMEAVKVDTAAPDASLFSVPDGYTEMKGFGGGAPSDDGGQGGSEASAGMAARMKAAMENMTPAQREAMQQSMKAQPGAGQ